MTATVRRACPGDEHDILRLVHALAAYERAPEAVKATPEALASALFCEHPKVFAHVAAEGNLETAMFGGKLPAGSIANFDAEETRLGKLPDDQLIAAMDKSLQLLSATLAGLSLDKMNTSITYYGQPTLPRVATTYTLNDLHEHLGQLVSYARMQQIVPPWSRKAG